MLRSANFSADDTTEEPITNKSRDGHKKCIKTRTPLHTLQSHKESICAINWTYQSTICTVSMDHTIKFCDCDLYGIKNEIVDQKAFLSESWSPFTVKMWDTRSIKAPLYNLEGHEEHAMAVDRSNNL